MRRVLALGSDTVVAGEARAENLGMIDEVRGRERHDVVAVLANVSRVDVGWVLPDRLGAVMTAEAIARNGGVIEVRWRPRSSRVAVVAVIATRNVRRVLAFGDRAVVAARTGTDHMCVINGPGRVP